MKHLLALLSCVSLLLLAGCHEDPYLTVSPSSLSFAEEGGSQTIQVSANYAWTASVSGSGFKISPASGEGSRFNAPSREAAYIRIHKLAYGSSWEYDYEEFVKYDAINRWTSVTKAPGR